MKGPGYHYQVGGCGSRDACKVHVICQKVFLENPASQRGYPVVFSCWSVLPKRSLRLQRHCYYPATKSSLNAANTKNVCFKNFPQDNPNVPLNRIPAIEATIHEVASTLPYRNGEFGGCSDTIPPRATATLKTLKLSEGRHLVSAMPASPARPQLGLVIESRIDGKGVVKIIHGSDVELFSNLVETLHRRHNLKSSEYVREIAILVYGKTFDLNMQDPRDWEWMSTQALKNRMVLLHLHFTVGSRG